MALQPTIEQARPGEPARAPQLDSPVDFGRETCGDLAIAEQREWLVTNGIGGFASGTIAGVLTRRYHGYLIAALKPPVGRTLAVAKLEETADYDWQAYLLGVNRWDGGGLAPEGHRYVDRFRLEGTTPVWTYACADALLEKRLWMEHGANTTYVVYRLVRASRPMRLRIKALVNYRDYHSSTHAGDWRMNVERVGRGLKVTPYAGAAPIQLLGDAASVEPAHDWYRNFDLVAEGYRRLDDREDHLMAGTFETVLEPGGATAIVMSVEAAPDLDWRAAAARHEFRQRALLARWAAARPEAAAQAPAWVRQFVLAADQFVVHRPLPDDPEARSLIAGYHWFGDWGRDTMIALPGLALTTGRPEIAAKILRTFARFADGGMMPNYFPDAGQMPEYNTVDASLWFVEAVRQYHAARGDAETLRALFPVLEDIVFCYERGTRFNIGVDADGLVHAGQPGVQLTWMDAKVGDRVVTPRIGKPVEVNALWVNALAAMAGFARALNEPAGAYDRMAARARGSFQRFWNGGASYLYDVIDGPAGDDASLRPNQIFAVSLEESPLPAAQQRAVVDACARYLLTPFGLRSLSPGDPQYKGRYGGSAPERDGAYHQGTVWGWLLGPFAIAHLKVFGDPAAAASFLEPMAHHVKQHGLGSASEIFDGDAPFAPRGCIAQAWTVGEALRAWHVLAEAGPRQITGSAKDGGQAAS